MPIRKSVIQAALRIGRLREQKAAAQAQRGLRSLNEAVEAARQLQGFAADYRRDAAQLGSETTVDLSQLLNTKKFADKLEETAMTQLQLAQPLREQVYLLAKEHYAMKRRLEGVEKIALRLYQEELLSIRLKESKEVEDNLAARLTRQRVEK